MPVALSTTGSRLAYSDQDTSVTIYNLSRTKVEQRITVGKVDDLQFSPDERLLAVAAAKQITIWDVARGDCLGEVEGDSKIVRSLAFAQDTRTLVSG